MLIKVIIILIAIFRVHFFLFLINSFCLFQAPLGLKIGIRVIFECSFSHRNTEWNFSWLISTSIAFRLNQTCCVFVKFDPNIFQFLWFIVVPLSRLLEGLKSLFKFAHWLWSYLWFCYFVFVLFFYYFMVTCPLLKSIWRWKREIFLWKAPTLSFFSFLLGVKLLKNLASSLIRCSFWRLSVIFAAESFKK